MILPLSPGAAPAAGRDSRCVAKGTLDVAFDPGEGQLVWFRGDFDRPKNYEPDGGLGVSNVDTTFKILGITRHERIPLGFTYSVKLDRDCSQTT